NLCKLHKPKSDYERTPEYHFNTLEKGIMCKECNGKMALVERRKLRCGVCTYKESLASAVMRSVVELSTLFPNQNITIGVVREWCCLELSSKIIRNTLKRYMRLHHLGHKSYYTFV